MKRLLAGLMALGIMCGSTTALAGDKLDRLFTDWSYYGTTDNGHAWKFISELPSADSVKTFYVAGYISGVIASTYSLHEQAKKDVNKRVRFYGPDGKEKFVEEMSRLHINMKQVASPHMPIKVISQHLDNFYSDFTNLRIPIVLAIHHAQRKYDGASTEELAALAAKWRSEFNKPPQKASE